MAPGPRSTQRSEKIRDALAFAAEASAHGETNIGHPPEVAELVERAGADEDVIAAAVLHDVVEDDGTDFEEIRHRFGDRVADLVGVMTEDESIEPYEDRKAEHRERASRAGRDAALIFVADKLANARAMQRGDKKPDPKKIGHYAATAELFRRRYPDLPLLGELENELGAIRRAAASLSA
jgi:(p)ppGpp synthase/HD superfamily hydrolase